MYTYFVELTTLKARRRGQEKTNIFQGGSTIYQSYDNWAIRLFMDKLERWEGIITEDGETFIAYTFEKDELFSNSALRALNSFSDSHLLRCVQMQWNGMNKCIFFTEGYRPLGNNLPSMESGRFREFMVSLLRTIINVRETSILKYGNIDLNSNHIFLDWNKGEVFLVCIPAAAMHTLPEAEFDINLRMQICQWLKQLPQSSQRELMGFIQALVDTNITLREIASFGEHGFGGARKMQTDGFIREEKKEAGMFAEKRAFRQQERSDPFVFGSAGSSGRHEQNMPPKLLLETVDETPAFRFLVDKSPFFIGRSVPQDHGQIGSKYSHVGRRHCRIEWTGDSFVLTDLNSRNGTWINSKKLTSGGSSVIRSGDRIKLYEITFLVRAVEED